MITDSSSAPQFSTPGVNAIGGVSITRLPSGAALGAYDLQRWSSNRSAGRFGSYTTKDERQVLDNWTKPKKTKAAHQAKRFSKTERLAFYQTKRKAAVALGIFVEQTSRGWIVSLPDGSNVGPFKQQAQALAWVNRQPSRRYGR